MEIIEAIAKTKNKIDKIFPIFSVPRKSIPNLYGSMPTNSKSDNNPTCSFTSFNKIKDISLSKIIDLDIIKGSITVNRTGTKYNSGKKYHFVAKFQNHASSGFRFN